MLGSGAHVKIGDNEYMLEDSAEVAWAAGFFDGEGHARVDYKCTSNNGNVYAFPHVSIHQVDRLPLDRFREAVGFKGKVNGPHKKQVNQRPIHAYQLGGRKAVQSVLNKLLPYLTGDKKEQARRVLIELQLYDAKARNWRGASGYPRKGVV